MLLILVWNFGLIRVDARNFFFFFDNQMLGNFKHHYTFIFKSKKVNSIFFPDVVPLLINGRSLYLFYFIQNKLGPKIKIKKKNRQ